MIKKLALSLYALALTASIIGAETALAGGILHYVSKPLLMPLLLLWYSQMPGAWKIPRLFFSLGFMAGWLGDIFLMDQSGHYFLAGLGSFLVGHALYIRGFSLLGRGLSLPITVKYSSLGVGIAVYSGIAAFLTPSFRQPDRMPLLPPVLFYCLVITLMTWYAFYAWRIRGGLLGWAFAGALLFMVSDFCIALNYFVLPEGLPYSHLIILSTYGIAQWFIACGTRSVGLTGQPQGNSSSG